MTARLLVVRHGESTWNAARRWQGWADPPLTPAGEESAGAAAAALREFGFGTVYSSDLDRAYATATIVAGALGLDPPVADARLRERDVGGFSGLTDTEISQCWPGQPARWRTDEDSAPPGGETAAEALARVTAGLVGATADRRGPVLVVSHGGVIRALERAFGADDPPLPNLSGRWFEVSAGRLACGHRYPEA